MEVVKQEIHIPVGTEQMNCYLAHPKGSGPYPALVVVMEVVGLTDDIRQTTDQFAAEGFVTLAPNLYFRVPGKQVLPYGVLPEALKLAATLTDDGIVRDMTAAIDFLKVRPDVKGKVGVVGFCMGGRITFLTACRNREVAASAPFYGGGIVNARSGQAPIEHFGNLAGPMLAFFGGKDEHIPLSDSETIRSRARELGKPVDVIVYPEAGHGFMCENTGRKAYHEASAKDAWPKTLAFFRQHLA